MAGKKPSGKRSSSVHGTREPVLTLSVPSGKDTKNPSPELVRDCILNSGPEFWQGLGWAIELEYHLAEGRMTKSMYLILHEPYGYTLFATGAGGAGLGPNYLVGDVVDPTPIVVNEIGEQVQYQRSMLIPRDIAWKVAEAFMQDSQRIDAPPTGYHWTLDGGMHVA